LIINKLQAFVEKYSGMLINTKEKRMKKTASVFKLHHPIASGKKTSNLLVNNPI